MPLKRNPHSRTYTHTNTHTTKSAPRFIAKCLCFFLVAVILKKMGGLTMYKDAKAMSRRKSFAVNRFNTTHSSLNALRNQRCPDPKFKIGIYIYKHLFVPRESGCRRLARSMAGGNIIIRSYYTYVCAWWVVNTPTRTFGRRVWTPYILLPF